MSKGNYTESRLKEATLEQLTRIMEGEVPLLTKEGRVVEDEDGNIVYRPASSAEIQAATAFLKVFPPQELPTPERVSPTMKKYSEKMPFTKEKQ